MTLKPALVYKFNNRPIKVRVLASSINEKIQNNLVTVDPFMARLHSNYSRVIPERYRTP
jgi:hypothetical protein